MKLTPTDNIMGKQQPDICRSDSTDYISLHIMKKSAQWMEWKWKGKHIKDLDKGSSCNKTKLVIVVKHSGQTKCVTFLPFQK